ncbi:MAG TPA: hypothetical protein PLF32_08890 [Bacteroidales bacterium]|nr:hypothetical protein [Bacteroidales bacterium]HOR82754.1 hypothetical protein [Bacteroidales bacterium]HPJ91970.1 hypothetical protein [Bacteroidales bacterium]
MIKLKKKQLSRLLLKHILFICLYFSFYNAEAQFYNGSQLSFGKGRVQTHQNIWSYYRTALADIYFYPQGKSLAEYVAKETQVLIPEIEKKLKYTLTNKIQIIIYSRHSDYMQSNIGLEVENFYNTGGVTPIYGHKIFLYFNGNINDFRESLKAGLVGLFINRIIRGNNILTKLTSADLVAIPYWFTDGMSAYFSKEWTAEIDNMIRDGILSGRYRKLHNLPIAEQAIAGYSFWHYIAREYGENMIINILHYIRALKNYERVAQVTLGINFEQLTDNWIDYYTKQYLTHPDYNYPDNTLLEKYKKHTRYLHPKTSPDGKNIAYITNQEGKVKVLIYNEETKKTKCIYRFHYRIEENPDYSFPLITWHPNSSTLMMIVEKKSKVYMIPYDMEEKKWGEKQIIFTHKITDFSYSSDGKYIAMSAINNGQSDIYIYTVASRSLVPVTNDKADDFAPRFIDNNKRLVFSSNRSNDTINKEEQSKSYQFGKYDLFVYNLETKSTTLQRITATPNAEEIYPAEIDNDYITFLSDNNGIYNRYLGKFTYEISHIDTGIHYTNKFTNYPISNSDNGILYQDININEQSIIDVVLYKGKYILRKENFPSIAALPEKNLTKTINQLYQSTKEQLQDSLSKTEEPIRHQKRFQFVKLIELNDTAYAKRQSLTTDMNETGEGIEKMTLVPRVYQTQYSLNSFAVQADFSFLNISYQQFVHSSNPIYLNPGLNLFTMIEAKDLMEDHRLIGGVRLSVDLNKEFIFSYEDFSQRLEKQVAIYYQSIKNMNYSGYYESQQNTSLFYILKYPFDRVNSLHFTTSLRHNRYALKATDDISLYQPNINSFWVGVKTEYVLDFSVPLSMNMKKGMRGKAFAEWMCTPNKTFLNMAVIGIDMRHYTPLHRNIVWANRFAASTSFGKNRLIYYMGGLDNWWFAKFNSDIYVDTGINYTYQALATNMRGFKQNIRNGTSFFVFNSEFRFSIIQLIMNKPLKNNFLNSLQIIAFGDIGTAWTGPSPYSESNSLFKQIIQSGPSIKITLNKQTEPIVAGFGTGIRFLLLGYFLRFDYAWGIENYKINKGMFYISLNLDF